MRLVADVRSQSDCLLRIARVLVVADVVARSFRVLEGVEPTGVVLGGSSYRAIGLASVLTMAGPRVDGWPVVGSVSDALDGLGGCADLVITSGSEELDIRGWWSTRRVPVADVATTGALDSELELRAGDGGGHLAALRMALLQSRPSDPAHLSWGRLHRAEETLLRWRRKVGAWADMPAVEPPNRYVDDVRAAISTDGDVVRVLRTLHRLEPRLRVASSSKYEVFILADEILGLDLGRLIGKPPFW